MGTRNRRDWTLDNQGEYARQIGWKHSRNGKLMQHKFRLGSDLKEAQRRERKIVEFWERIEETTDTTPVVWTDFALDVAKQLAKGKLLIEISRKQHDSAEAYARYLHRVQKHYPMIPFVADDADAYAEGSSTNRTQGEASWVQARFAAALERPWRTIRQTNQERKPKPADSKSVCRPDPPRPQGRERFSPPVTRKVAEDSRRSYSPPCRRRSLRCLHVSRTGCCLRRRDQLASTRNQMPSLLRFSWRRRQLAVTPSSSHSGSDQTSALVGQICQVHHRLFGDGSRPHDFRRLGPR